jgi:hypothetical protein
VSDEPKSSLDSESTRFVVDLAESISNRRLVLSSIYLVINTALLGLGAFLAGQTDSRSTWSLLAMIGLSMLGCGSCLAWISGVRFLAARSAWWYTKARSQTNDISSLLIQEFEAFYVLPIRRGSTHKEIVVAAICLSCHLVIGVAAVLSGR